MSKKHMSWGLSSGFDSCEDTLMVSEGWSTIIVAGSVAAGEVAESSASCRQQEVCHSDRLLPTRPHLVGPHPETVGQSRSDCHSQPGLLHY